MKISQKHKIYLRKSKMQTDIIYKIFKTKIQHFLITFYGYKDIW